MYDCLGIKVFPRKLCQSKNGVCDESPPKRWTVAETFAWRLPYYQRAFSPLDPTAIWLSHLALAIYMFVVNFDALPQASDFHPASARYASGSSIWGIKGFCKFVIYLIFYQTGRKNPGLTHFATLWRVCVSISLSDSTLTHPPWKNGHHLEDDIFKRIFPNENFYILSPISLKFVQRVLV